MFVDETHHDPPKGWEQKRGATGAALDGVSCADAVAYCRWLTVGTGRIYRLPDEREWEKAARVPGTLDELGALREWTNSWQNGGRGLRAGAEPGARLFAGEKPSPGGAR